MALPATMKAAAIDRFGPPSMISIHELPVPEPDAGEVLIALSGAGVGIWDAMIRVGTWAPDKVSFPYVLGTDGAGVVAAVGSRVRRFKVGDRVWAYAYQNPKGGFYAEYVAVDADSVGRAPKELDLIEAAAGAVTGLTALQGVDDHLKLERGETVLLLGATGAVGTLALQVAKWRRARVIATATGSQAQRLVKKLGADAVFDARAPDAVDRMRELTPDGLDAVLAFAGGPPLEYASEHVRPGGRIAYPNGVEPEPRRRSKVRITPYDAEASPEQWDRLKRAVAGAKLRVVIAAKYPLAKAAEAHARVEEGHVLGRIALRIRRGR